MNRNELIAEMKNSVPPERKRSFGQSKEPDYRALISSRYS